MILTPAAFLALSLLGPASGGCGGGHVVVRGDTLYSIARRCGSSVAEVARASGLADPTRIEVGQRLLIPGADGDEAKPEDERADEPAAGPGYRFEPGDTLYSLARWARVSLAALMTANPGIDPHKIEIGDEIRLPRHAANPARARARERGAAPPPPPVVRPVAPAPPPPLRHHAPRAAPPADDDKPDEADVPEREHEPEPEGM